MGYYTSFELYIDNANELDDVTIRQVEKAIEELDIFDRCGRAIYGWSAYTKWYDCDQDMQALSYRFPTVVFDLRGDGEEQEDLWQHYYQGGRVQRDGLVVTYTWNGFDPKKLDPLTPEEESGIKSRSAEMFHEEEANGTDAAT